MEPTRARTARDAAAAEARRRPSTQYAAQHPDYLEQAQALRGRPGATSVAERDAAPARSQWADLFPERTAPQPQTGRQAPSAPRPVAVRAAPKSPGLVALRRLTGLAAFAVLTLLSLPIHVLALFFVYVQEQSPGDLAGSAALLIGLLAGVFLAMLITGVLTQLIGGFPGRWRARVVFAGLSGAIALGVAYAAALTQHF